MQIHDHQEVVLFGLSHYFILWNAIFIDICLCVYSDRKIFAPLTHRWIPILRICSLVFISCSGLKIALRFRLLFLVLRECLCVLGLLRRLSLSLLREGLLMVLIISLAIMIALILACCSALPYLQENLQVNQLKFLVSEGWMFDQVW